MSMQRCLVQQVVANESDGLALSFVGLGVVCMGVIGFPSQPRLSVYKRNREAKL